jgi:hypothetical protein
MKRKPEDTLKRWLAPGAWEDANGNIHFALPDLLKHFGMADSPDNRRHLTRVIREIMEKEGSSVVERPNPPGYPK